MCVRKKKSLLMFSEVKYYLGDKKYYFQIVQVELNSDSQCSKNLLTAIESTHWDYERNVCREWTGFKMCGKQT